MSATLNRVRYIGAVSIASYNEYFRSEIFTTPEYAFVLPSSRGRC